MTDVRPLPGTTLPVSEVFGPVWQGEGPHTGRRCSFLRLGLCNLRCAWCDTPYTWDTTRYDIHAECPDRDPHWIHQRLIEHETSLLILSGGEPLIHQNSAALHDLLGNITHELHVETNGTLIPAGWLQERVGHWTVSPKLAHGGDPEDRRIHGDALHAFAELAVLGRCAWKIVVGNEADVKEASQLMDHFAVPSAARWLMPEGITAVDVLDRARHLERSIAESGANLTLRQHTLLYGTERGR